MSDTPHDQRLAHLSPLKQALYALERTEGQLAGLKQRLEEPVAIVGRGCRFPGGANDPERFFRQLCAGKDAVAEVPADRWDVEAYYDPNPEVVGKMASRWGGFLDGVDVRAFDAAFFHMAPREAVGLDPMHRLLLEVSCEALDDAGLPRQSLVGRPVGTYVGIMHSDYLLLAHGGLGDPALAGAHILSGTCVSMAAGRLSFTLGLQGPCLAVNTACSSSLAALHLAVGALRAGECEVALVGGVNLILAPEGLVVASQFGAANADGRCKTFDAGADGTALGEGCGVLVLKRLADARRDGDRIRALVRGTAVNHDGASSSLTAPNGLAQMEVIRRALAAARLSPRQVGYVEAHGTGTVLGDPIEAEALARVYGDGRPPGEALVVGALKTQIAHLAAAAGVASVIKAVGCLERGVIPPNLHFERLNPNIDWRGAPIVLPTAPEPFPARDEPRRAAISAFGWSGVNAHVVLEEAPRPIETPRAPEASAASEPRLLPLSAASAPALAAQIERWVAFLAEPTGQDPEATPDEEPGAFSDLCYTAGARRDHLPHRLAVVAADLEELRAGLLAARSGEARSGLVRQELAVGRESRLAFVFSGQGSQYFGMGRELLGREGPFRETLAFCDALLRARAGWSLLEELALPEERSRLRRVDVAQPVLFALQLALAAEWRAHGLHPDGVVGHSLGELAAAVVAGALSPEEGMAAVVARSALLAEVRGQGLMAQVELPFAEARVALAPFAGALSVAAVNSRRATVVAGDPESLGTFLEQLEGRGVHFRMINADGAGHSPQLDALKGRLGAALGTLVPREANVPIYSTVSGGREAGSHVTAEYLERNLREPVLFAPTVERMIDEGFELFVELSPEPILLPSILDLLHQKGRKGATVPSLRRGRPERRTLLEGLGQLYVEGRTPSWAALHPQGGRVVSLPAYPWQRERYWLPEDLPRTGGGGREARTIFHPLLETRLAVPGEALELFEQRVGIPRQPYLRDHRLHGTALLPAAATLELVRAAAALRLGEGSALALEEVTLGEAVVLLEQQLVPLTLVLAEEGAGRWRFHLHAGTKGGKGDAEARAVASGRVRLAEGGAKAEAASGRDSLEELLARCARQVPVAEFYRALREAGIEYGPLFQPLSRLWLGEGEALAELALPRALARGNERYGLHPVILDGALQVVAAAARGTEGHEGAFLPVGFGRLTYLRAPSGSVKAHARLEGPVAPGAREARGELTLFDESGPFVRLEGFRARRADEGADAGEKLERAFLRPVWRGREAESEPTLYMPPRVLLVGGGEAAEALGGALSERGLEVVVAARSPGFARAASGRYELALDDAAGLARLVAEALPTSGSTPVVYLGGLEVPAGLPPEGSEAGRRATVEALWLAQALLGAGRRDAPRLWLVTRGAQAVRQGEGALAPHQAPLWGLGRTAGLEAAELRPTCLDLDAGAPLAEQLSGLVSALLTDDREGQLALRGGASYVLRFERGLPAAGARGPAERRASDPFCLAIPKSGLLEELALVEQVRTPPGPGEVELAVRAAGLNFNDVMKAMGIYPGDYGLWLGSECAGVVTAVGPGVSGLAPGDRVVALAPHAMGSYVTTPAHLVVHKPAGLSFTEAAGVPVAWLTARLALFEIGRLQAGERVLIHAAAGGVGLAAVQLARRAGAEVWGTAGSEEKRTFLRGLGVAQVFDSRSLAFADEVRRLTDGRGVDLVLNCLAGEAMEASLGLVAPYGRFLEIGRKDIYQNTRLGLRPFERNLAYHGFDLLRFSTERPVAARRALEELLAELAAGTLEPLPCEVFPMTEAAAAFQKMAKARHVGKLVLVLPEDPEARLPVRPAARRIAVRADATYLLSGGTGDLGLELAAWLVEQGARHLILLSRRGRTPELEGTLQKLEARGATLEVLALDVADGEALLDALAARRGGAPPVRGVVHLAGVLEDAVLPNVNPGQLARVLRPKVDGALALDRATRDEPLDFFVLYASASGLLGSPGQASYAAANAFLDAFASYRVAAGRPALSIDWGPFENLGAESGSRGRRLAQMGLQLIRGAEGVAAFGRLLEAGAPLAQVGMLWMSPRHLLEAFPAAELPALEALAEETAAEARPRGESDVQRALAAAAPNERGALLLGHLRGQLAHVLQVPLERVEAETPLRQLGMDSLMTVDLRNRIEASLGLVLPATLVWKYPTLSALTEHLLERLTESLATPGADEAAEVPTAARAEKAEAPPAPAASLGRAEVDALSDEEAEALLAAKLDALGPRGSA
ncbi:MAG: type I polyketide synthase [Deltaproteobacteria bacterium]|nr:type I polyketide synthase [Deltaproteobacteria bacterium]